MLGDSELNGTTVFRVGGDEYIIVSETKSKEEVEDLLRQVNGEVEQFEFSYSKPVPTGINFGVTERTKGESIDRLYTMADKLLSDNKTATYEKMGIERRK